MKLQKPSDLARLVKNARAERNLTQQDVAAAVGITRQSLARVERGNGGTSFDTIILILDHLGIQLEAHPVEPATAATRAPVVQNAALAAAAELAKHVTPSIPTELFASLSRGTTTSSLSGLDISALQKAATAGIELPKLSELHNLVVKLSPKLNVPGSVTRIPPRVHKELTGPSAPEEDADPEVDDTADLTRDAE